MFIHFAARQFPLGYQGVTNDSPLHAKDR